MTIVITVKDADDGKVDINVGGDGPISETPAFNVVQTMLDAVRDVALSVEVVEPPETIA